MKLTSTVLFVKNIEVSKKFYVEILNQEIEQDFGKNIMFQSGLSIWEINENHIIATHLRNTKDENSFEIYFENNNLYEIQTKLKMADVNFLHEIQEEAWGQQTMRFFDPDKHLIEIGEEMSAFVKRMFSEGLTLAEISAKTGITQDIVNQFITN